MPIPNIAQAFYRYMNPANRPQYEYNPYQEAIFEQAFAQKPTTSPIGAVVKGILGTYVGTKLGEARKAFAQEEKARARRERIEDEMTILGAKQAMESVSRISDPTKFVTAPETQSNLDVIAKLMTTNPEFIRGQGADPTFAMRAIRNVASPNQALGIFGARPIREPIKKGPEESLYDPVTFQEIVPGKPKAGKKIGDIETIQEGDQEVTYEITGFDKESGAPIRKRLAAGPKFKPSEGETGEASRLGRIRQKVKDAYEKTGYEQGVATTQVPEELRLAERFVGTRAAEYIMNFGIPEDAAINRALGDAELEGLTPVPEGTVPGTRWYQLIPPEYRPLDPNIGLEKLDIGGISIAEPSEKATPQTKEFIPSAKTTVPYKGQEGYQILPSPSAMLGLFGKMLTPKPQKDEKGWYISIGGKGGKKYISDDEAMDLLVGKKR